VVGPSIQNLTGAVGRNRYYQALFNYTLVFPENWSWEETTTTLSARAPEDIKATLNVEVQRLQDNKEPRLFMRENLGLPELTQTEALSQFGLKGWTGINAESGERKAVIFYSQRAYIFTSSADSPALETANLDIIKSFRPIARNEGVFANPLKVTWIQASAGTTYAQLARSSRIPDYAEDTLRLMNGDYPAGEPKAGEWIKITD
jgi:predicted Zn-dependent protease